MTIIVNAVSFGSLLACGVLLCPTEGNAQGPHIAVPEVESGRVVVDGRFAPGEWEGAYRYEASERLEVYFLADSADLCIGFKFLDDVEADFVAEVYIAINEDEFLTLHSSGALGEGTSAFSPGLRGPAFAVGNAVGWQSNVTGTGVRSEGKEFRISRGKLPGATIKAAGGMIVVSATIRERAGFPGAFGFESPAGWMELVLPGTMLPETSPAGSGSGRAWSFARRPPLLVLVGSRGSYSSNSGLSRHAGMARM